MTAWPLLDDLPEADVRRLVAIARRRRFGRSEVVFHQGDPGIAASPDRDGPLRGADYDTAGRHGRVRDPSVRRRLRRASARRPLGGPLPPRSPRSSLPRRCASTRRISRGHARTSHRLTGCSCEFLCSQVRRMNERLVEALYIPADDRVAADAWTNSARSTTNPAKRSTFRSPKRNWRAWPAHPARR